VRDHRTAHVHSDNRPPRFASRVPSRRATARSDLSEATLPGSIISLLAMFAMVVLFFLVRSAGRYVCRSARVWGERAR
jgi:hypothetical protein